MQSICIISAMCRHSRIVPRPFHDFPCYCGVHRFRQTPRSHQYVLTSSWKISAKATNTLETVLKAAQNEDYNGI